MLKLSLNLPLKKRLHLHLVERRGDSVVPILPRLEDVVRVRKGSRISRFFRHIFEHKNVRKLFGANIALMITATTFFPSPTINPNIQAEENIIESGAVVLPTERAIRYPVEEVKITQDYKLFHSGIDLDGATGDSVYPVMKGKVEAVDFSKYAYGNAVYINHGSGIASLYAHLSKIVVKTDDEVTTNTKIGEMGATGRASGDHLHLEIRKNGVPINPLTILPR